MNLVQEVMDYISGYDPEVGKGLELELARQRRNLELIASENIVSPAVMLAMGTVPTANMWTSWKYLLSSGRKSCSARSTLVYSRTREPRRIWRFTRR